MKTLDHSELKEIISIDTFNDTSLFAVVAVDLSDYKVIYSNQAMNNIMADMLAENCWEAINGQNAPCFGCKAPILLDKLNSNRDISQTKIDHDYITYEKFNEVANKWYQVQEKVITLKDSRNVLLSFALDISLQKEAQSKLIDTHVKLTKQTQALQKAQEQLQNLVNRDPLTDIHNRRYFNEKSQELIANAKENNTPLSVLMIDIDKFKNINDTYGHSVGDEVIKFLANKLSENRKENDVVARFGGEEFGIILPNTNEDDALVIAQNIRKDVESSSLDLYCDIDKKDHRIQFTVSIGVEEFDAENDVKIDTILNRADKALYKAKNGGRNKVCTFK